MGLSTRIDETTHPACEELIDYKGPTDTLKKLFKNDLRIKKVDIAFIDSRKGNALAEFLIISEHLSPNGIIFCHDILNFGKGVEVLDYIKNNMDVYKFEVIDTGPAGMIKIKLNSY